MKMNNPVNKLLAKYTLFLFGSSMAAMLMAGLFADEVDAGLYVAIIFVSAVFNAKWLIVEALETGGKIANP